MKESIESIIQWHKDTFPDATLEGQKAKFEEELNEYKQDKIMPELADMFIVACGVARFDIVEGIKHFASVNKELKVWKKVTIVSESAFQTIVDDKMKKNRNRIWKKTGDGLYHHKNGIED